MRRLWTRAAFSSVVARNINFDAVASRIEQRGVIAPAALKQYIAQYQALGFEESYSKFKLDEVVEHLCGYISGKLAAAEGEHPTFAAEKEYSALYITRGTAEDFDELVKCIERFLVRRQSLSVTHGVSMKMFRSKSGDTVLTTISFSPYFGPLEKDTDKMPADIDIVGTPLFKESRSTEALERSRQLLSRMANGHTTASTVFTSPQGDAALSVAFFADRVSLLGPLFSLMNEISGATVVKCFKDTFANGVHIYTLYVRGATAAQVEEQAALVQHVPNRPNSAITQLLSNRSLTAKETIFAHCLITFAYYFTISKKSEDYQAVLRHLNNDAGIRKRFLMLHGDLQQEVMSERHIGLAIAREVAIVKSIFADFEKGSTESSRKVIIAAIDGCKSDEQTKDILRAFVRFNEAVRKHNFAKANKAAIAFRLDPAVTLRDTDFVDIPHGIFLLVGPRWRGFHVRFTEIARGGVRMIISDSQTYKANKKTLFSENYRLAFAQMLKNKDIPEGGSKGTILINTLAGTPSVKARERMFMQYTDTLLDVMLENQSGVIDNLGQREILFLGPDENTAGELPTLGAQLSKARGYPLWKSFTTGKSPSIGGIPHEVYGMTTLGIRRCVDLVYEKMGLDGSKLTKFMTGGPLGDLGSNEIMRGTETIISIVDGSGVAYDPKGLDKQELLRLVRSHQDIIGFDPKCLSEGGFVVAATDAPVTLPDGAAFASGTELRNVFHFTKYAEADVFIPCGGRPSSVTISNVHKFVKNHPALTGEQMLSGGAKDVKVGDLKYRVIVEGANLFITEDARLALEKVGVQLIKDSTANKGGVTSSSVEVFVGLSLSDEEFMQHMSAGADPKPKFYVRIVEEIQAIIQRNAQREVELIYREQQKRPLTPKCVISDELSRKITSIRSFIIRSNLLKDPARLKKLVEAYAPAALKELVPVDKIVARVPAQYLESIGAVWIASNYIYENGVSATELDFYEFMLAKKL